MLEKFGVNFNTTITGNSIINERVGNRDTGIIKSNSTIYLLESMFLS